MVNGVQQSPMEGTSMLYTFNDADAAERHDLQYFEMFGNRGIYHKGWSAVTKHKTPWVMVGGEMPAFDDDLWELYDGNVDYSQAHDLAAEQPEMLAKLQRLWLIEAVKYNVVPMDDRSAERVNPELAGRPTLIRGNSQLFFAGMGRLSENSVVEHQEQVVLGHRRRRRPRQWRQRGDHRPRRPLRWLGRLLQGRRAPSSSTTRSASTSTRPPPTPRSPAGNHQVRMEFAYDGGGLAKGGDVTLYYDGTAGRHADGSSTPTR